MQLFDNFTFLLGIYIYNVVAISWIAAGLNLTALVLLLNLFHVWISVINSKHNELFRLL